MKRLRSFIHPKLWLRLSHLLFTGKISLHRFWVIFSYHFRKTVHNIPALVDFDKAHGVKATYFFIMNQSQCKKDGLGSAYTPEEAKPLIDFVRANGFDAGVHGIVFNDSAGMKAERDTWAALMGTPPDCIRNHYVRYDDKTFERLSELGYVYDSTEFHKPERCTIKAPYKVGSMWEFPLNIMEGYLPNEPHNTEGYLASLEQLQGETLRIIGELQEKGIKYLTVLFHDHGFCECKEAYMNWYKWFVSYVEETPGFEIVSYREAIALLEGDAVR